jgi:hypothetical protein
MRRFEFSNSYLTEKGVLAMNPAREVQTERFSRLNGKTPAFHQGEVATLLGAIDPSTMSVCAIAPSWPPKAPPITDRDPMRRKGGIEATIAESIPKRFLEKRCLL